MEFYAYHGCFKEESVVGTRFVINLELFLDSNRAEESDDLHDTINYLHVYQLIKLCMQTKSKLLEHLARRILLNLFVQYPKLDKVLIKVSKMNPPLGGQLASVSVILQYDGKRFS
jgi:dihydroneopterin aldolase